MGIEFGSKVRQESDYQNRHLIVGYSLLHTENSPMPMAFCSCGAVFLRKDYAAADNAHAVHKFLATGDRVVSWAM